MLETNKIFEDALSIINGNKKSLVESTQDNTEYQIKLCIPESIETPTFFLHKSLALENVHTLYISSDIIHENNFQDILKNEIKNFSSMIHSIKTDDELKNSKDINDFANNIVYICGVDATKENIYNKVIKFIGDNKNPSEYTYFSNLYLNDTVQWKKEAKNLIKLIHEKIKDKKHDDGITSYTNMILDEGMINVPNKLYSVGKNIIDYFIYKMVKESAYSENEYKMGLEFLKKMGYDVSMLQSLGKTEIGKNFRFSIDNGLIGNIDVQLTSDDFPYENNIGKTIVNISVINQQNNSMGGHYYQDGQSQVFINLYHLFDKMKKLGKNPELFEDSLFKENITYLIQDSLKTLTHELMHVVQYNIFMHKEYTDDPKSTSNKNRKEDDTWDNYEKYALSPVEFDPIINDTIEEFKSRLESLENYVSSIDVDTKKELLHKFLGSKYVGSLPEKLSKNIFSDAIELTFQPTPFIVSLRERDLTSWEKASKKIYSELFHAG